MGVLLDISQDAYWEEITCSDSIEYGMYVHDGGDGDYPTIFSLIGEWHPLARMNDHGKTFPEIADWVEEHL